jgi:hypothetical protein
VRPPSCLAEGRQSLARGGTVVHDLSDAAPSPSNTFLSWSLDRSNAVARDPAPANGASTPADARPRSASPANYRGPEERVTLGARLSLSTGATRDAGPSCSARKYASYEMPVAMPDSTKKRSERPETLPSA